MDSNTIIAGNINALDSSMDKSTRQKISKETQALNDTLNQMDLIDIYRALHPKAAEYTFFSMAHGTFSRIDPLIIMQCQKAFNRRFPVCCFRSVRNSLFFINS